MSVRAVNDQDIHAGTYQFCRALHISRIRPDRSTHSQPAMFILSRFRILPALEDVLYRYQSLEITGTIDHRQLLDLVPMQHTLGFLQRCAHRYGDQLVAGHHLADRSIEVGLELQVAVGDDADQPAILLDDRHPADGELPHETVGVAQRGVGPQRNRIENHAALRPLDPVDLRRLLFDRHVLVHDADTAVPGHRDRHLGFGHRVHRRRDQRDRQL